MADASVAPRDRPLTYDEMRIELILERLQFLRTERPSRRTRRGRVLPQHLWITAGMALNAARTFPFHMDLTSVMDVHMEDAYGEVVCSISELEGNPWGFGACNRVFRAWDAALELQHYAANLETTTLSDEDKRDLDAVKALLVRAKKAENTFFAGIRWRRPWARDGDDF